MARSLGVLAVLIFSLAVATLPARGDWLNVSGAENAPNILEIEIEADHVRIELEIFVDDVITFDRLIPDEYLPGLDIERPPLAERLQAFAAEDLQVIADGETLVPRLDAFEPRIRKYRPSPNAGKLNPYTGQVIPGPPEDDRVFYAELVYELAQRPSSLTFVPPIDEDGVGRIPIGFVTYHQLVPVNDFRFLGGAAKLSLDWDDPWYSEFEEKALKRWQRGAVMSFLYVEPLEVRHEVLARVRDLEAWLDLGLRGDEFIEPDENEPLKQRIGDFLLKRDRVTIDGERLTPILDRTAFVKYSMTGSTFLTQPERLPIDTATIGVIVTYLTDRMPDEVAMEWDLWSERIQTVPTDAIDPAGPFPSEVTASNNVHVWQNFLTYEPPTVAELALDRSLTTLQLPLASAMCFAALLPVAWVWIRRRRREESGAGLLVASVLLAGAGLLLRPYAQLAVHRPNFLAASLTDDQARTVLDGLLRNTYRSFDFRREEDVYDRLALSVSGDLLEEVYLENRRSLAVTQAGGAQARVQTVEVLEAEVEPLTSSSLGMRCRASWTAEGSVNHWGHVHTRKNLYRAELTVEPVDAAWRITGLEVLEETRLDSAASVPR